MNSWKIAALTLALLGVSATGRAQGYVDQKAVEPLLSTQGQEATVTPVGWHLYPISSTQKTSKAVLARLQKHLDSLPGGLQGQRMAVVELTNRLARKYILQRSELLVPDRFDDDFRAYAPYPQEWTAAASTPKLFVIDKYTQTFGAYENGQLVRWGLVSTGADDEKTPTGRYTFNWKQELRNSSEAPEGETWEMRWVVNFCESKGLHVHQYALPIAQPASHGCVRLTEADALWNYGWAERGTPVLVLNYSPVGLAAHWLPGTGRPVSLVMLPDDPMGVPVYGKGVASR